MAHRGTLHPSKALDLVSKVLLLSQLDRIATLVAHLSFFAHKKKKKKFEVFDKCLYFKLVSPWN